MHSCLVNSKDKVCDYGTLQYFHIIGIVGGIILCISGIFNVAELI